MALINIAPNLELELKEALDDASREGRKLFRELRDRKFQKFLTAVDDEYTKMRIFPTDNLSREERITLVKCGVNPVDLAAAESLTSDVNWPGLSGHGGYDVGAKATCGAAVSAAVELMKQAYVAHILGLIKDMGMTDSDPEVEVDIADWDNLVDNLVSNSYGGPWDASRPVKLEFNHNAENLSIDLVREENSRARLKASDSLSSLFAFRDYLGEIECDPTDLEAELAALGEISDLCFDVSRSYSASYEVQLDLLSSSSSRIANLREMKELIAEVCSKARIYLADAYSYEVVQDSSISNLRGRGTTLLKDTGLRVKFDHLSDTEILHMSGECVLGNTDRLLNADAYRDESLIVRLIASRCTGEKLASRSLTGLTQLKDGVPLSIGLQPIFIRREGERLDYDTMTEDLHIGESVLPGDVIDLLYTVRQLATGNLSVPKTMRDISYDFARGRLMLDSWMRKLLCRGDTCLEDLTGRRVLREYTKRQILVLATSIGFTVHARASPCWQAAIEQLVIKPELDRVVEFHVDSPITLRGLALRETEDSALLLFARRTRTIKQGIILISAMSGGIRHAEVVDGDLPMGAFVEDTSPVMGIRENLKAVLAKAGKSTYIPGGDKGKSLDASLTPN